jgi:hypothetical protein
MIIKQFLFEGYALMGCPLIETANTIIEPQWKLF